MLTMIPMEKLNHWLTEKRGRLSLLAKELGITPAAIKQWDVIPAERLPVVSKLTGISMYELRPGFIETGILSKKTKSKQIEAAQ